MKHDKFLAHWFFATWGSVLSTQLARGREGWSSGRSNQCRFLHRFHPVDLVDVSWSLTKVSMDHHSRHLHVVLYLYTPPRLHTEHACRDQVRRTERDGGMYTHIYICTCHVYIEKKNEREQPCFPNPIIIINHKPPRHADSVHIFS